MTSKPRILSAPENEFTAAERAAVHPFIEKCVAGNTSAIVVGLVDESGRQVFSAGTLDNGTDRQVDGDSMFSVGSVSKTFTALLLLDMVRRGEVQLDDPVSKYLPEGVRVPMHGGKRITLEHLAAQSSGLPFNPDNMSGVTFREQYESYNVAKLYAFLGRVELTDDPGTKFTYSNVGMALLGHALPRRTGTSYESLIVERICRPLGMYDTCNTLSAGQRARLAMGRDELGRPASPWKFDAYRPAGDIHSSANDLLEYVAAHAGLTSPPIKPLLEQSHVIRFHDEVGTPEESAYGPMGRTATPWVDRNAVQAPGMDLLGHAGGSGSYHAWVGFDIRQHRGVVVLSTDNDISVEAIGWTVLQRLPLTAERKTMFARKIVGIGAALAMNGDGGALQIAQVLPDSPASRAGFLPGFSILEIDGQTTIGKKVEDCVKLIRGPAGTKLRLKIIESPDAEAKTVELTRQPFAT